MVPAPHATLAVPLASPEGEAKTTANLSLRAPSSLRGVMPDAPKPQPTDKEARLAERLRENLRRRKAPPVPAEKDAS